MNINKHFDKVTLLLLILFLSAMSVFAQVNSLSTAPREEKLLNGLKLLIWNQPNAEKVSVKIRIHNGSAFDPQSKEGTMALLSDALFPNESVKEFFREDLGGSLEVTSNFDYIQIDATAKSDQFLTMLESLAGALTNLQLDKETVAKIRALRLEKVKELEKNPTYIADRATAKKLFGDFPYGRAQAGTSESLGKIDFADLILAKEKFLTSDNATIAIAGNVKPEFAYRAARRLFGSWVKSDKKIPATFRQPDAPDTKPLLFKTEIENAGELRSSFRGSARSDKDFYAECILTRILQNRLQAEKAQNGIIRRENHLLAGSVVFEFPNWNAEKIKVEGNQNSVPADFRRAVADLLKTDITQNEFEKAKNDFLSEYNKQNPMDLWLDADTYKLASVKEETQKASSVSLSDVQRVLQNWRKEPVVSAFVATATK